MELTKNQSMLIVITPKDKPNYQIEISAQRVKDTNYSFKIMVHPTYNKFGEIIQGAGFTASEYSTGAGFPIGKTYNYPYPEDAARAAIDLIESKGVEYIEKAISELEVIN